ncbi:MAG: beta-propeller fold lactonase family protein [Spirochaetales bacterium]|nr:beta-propeller fold lactonase family protein [Spirochaetales bacterium]
MPQIKVLLIMISFFLSSFISCQYSFKVSVTPDDGFVYYNGDIIANNTTITASQPSLTVHAYRDGYNPMTVFFSSGSPFSVANAVITLSKKTYRITVDVIEGVSEAIIDGRVHGTTPLTLRLTQGRHSLVLKRNDYPDAETYLDVSSDKRYTFRQKENPSLGRQIGIFPCGSQPKQVIFSPDNNYLFIVLLDGKGFQIFDVKHLEMTAYVDVGQHTRYKSFVEGLFIKETHSFIVSQMTTGKLIEYNLQDVFHTELKRIIDSHGRWPKFFAYSPVLRKLAVSNWTSNDVSIIDYASGNLERKLGPIVVPRGIAWSSDGKFLYICSFDGGRFYKYDTESWKELAQVYRPSAAMRHVVLSSDNRMCYVSDMFHSLIYAVDAETFKVVHVYRVFNNPNSMEISPDDRYLYVSCRGPNNPKSYLLRSPVNGKIYIIDLKERKVLSKIDAGNQPTGLDLSSDGRILAFSNFRDDRNFELYDMSELTGY